MDTLNLKLPDYYINRELSQLAFNVRVLEQAKDTSLPLLERLKFLCISSTNLDEFFEIRVSGLKHRLEVSAGPTGPDNLSPAEVLRTLGEQTSTLVTEQYRVLNDELIPALRDEGIRFVRRDDWSSAQRQWLEQHFRTRDRAGAESHDARPDAPVSTDPEQELELHRAAWTAATRSAARVTAPSCRRRARCRG